MKTEVTELLGIEYPIIQGGMAWVAEYHLAAGVSNAGGLGLIGAASAPAEWVREQIREAKKLTDKPFGVNIMLISPYAEDVAKVVAEEGVKVVTTGAGSPEKYMKMWKEAGIKVIPVVASVALARRMERCGADAVVAEGCESGGHIGENTTMVLVPQIVDAVKIPVIAAGGIADGRGIAAAFMLGAKAVQMGTHFVATEESIVHENYKNAIIKAKDIDSRVTGRSTGHPVRALRNQMTKKYLDLEKNGASFEELEHLTLGGLRKAVVDGDVTNGSVMAGQSAAMVTACLAMTAEIEKRGLTPDVTAGLSLGEYCAISAAGGMQPKDAISLVRKRGILMQNTVPAGEGAMAAILGLDGETVEKVTEEIPGASVANYNCPGQIVITGKTAAVEKAAESLKAAGAKRAVLLNVSGPFHSKMLESAGEELAKEMEKRNFEPLAIPYVTNVTAKYVTDIKETKALLAKQISSPVRWEESVRTMIEDGVDTFVEIGPGKTLAGFMRRIDKGVKVYNIETWEDMEKVIAELV